MALAMAALAAETATTATAPAATNWLLAIIPILTPMIIAVIKWGAPKIPKAILPVLCPIIGAALDIVGYYAGITPGTGIAGAVLGASGLWLRELIDQVGKVKVNS